MSGPVWRPLIVTSWTTLSRSAISSSIAKRELGERCVEVPHRLLDALWSARLVRVRRVVVHEIGVDQLVSQLDIALRVELLERPANEPLIVVRHGPWPHPAGRLCAFRTFS
jgi:hypothetical protein